MSQSTAMRDASVKLSFANNVDHNYLHELSHYCDMTASSANVTTYIYILIMFPSGFLIKIIV